MMTTMRIMRMRLRNIVTMMMMLMRIMTTPVTIVTMMMMMMMRGGALSGAWRQLGRSWMNGSQPEPFPTSSSISPSS